MADVVLARDEHAVAPKSTARRRCQPHPRDRRATGETLSRCGSLAGMSASAVRSESHGPPSPPTRARSSPRVPATAETSPALDAPWPLDRPPRCPARRRAPRAPRAARRRTAAGSPTRRGRAHARAVTAPPSSDFGSRRARLRRAEVANRKGDDRDGEREEQQAEERRRDAVGRVRQRRHRRLRTGSPGRRRSSRTS